MSSSALSAEQRQKIEENRKRALEKKAAAEAAKKPGFVEPHLSAPIGQAKHGSYSTPPLSSLSSVPCATFYSKSTGLSNKRNNKVPANKSLEYTSSPDAKRLKLLFNGKVPSSSDMSTHGSPSSTVTGLCKMVSKERFTVEAGYHLGMINSFKTMPSRIYDAKSRNWNFNLKDYEKLLTALKSLQPAVKIAPLPSCFLKAFRKTEQNLPEDINETRIDPKLFNALMPFQLEGIKFCVSRGGRALIADDMGLGKTIQALGVAYYYKDDWPMLIVCPSSVRFAWAEAVRMWLPSVPAHKISIMISGKDYVNDAKVLILSYDLLTRQGLSLRARYGVLILDESHCLKNFKTSRTKAAQPFIKAARRVLLLSGTPALSRPIELYCQMAAVNSSAIPSLQEFGVRYCAGQMKNWGWDFTGSSNMDELLVLLKECFMIRRLKSEVLIQLPAKFRQVIVLPPNSIDLKSAELQAAAKNLTSNNLHGVEKQGALLAYFNTTSYAKLNGICDYITDLVESEKKFLCFAHHRVVLDGICEILESKKCRYVRIDGSTDPSTRQDNCREFQEQERCRVAVLSITAASTGITLTSAHLVLFAELFWNPGVLLQAEDRAHRLGQMDNVVVQYLVAEGTADDHLWSLLQRKLDVLKKLGLNEDNLTSTAATSRINDKTQPAITNFLEPQDTTAEDDDDELLSMLDLDALA